MFKPDIGLIKTLRAETGISVSLCKKALEESRGDIDKAKKILESWGVEKLKSKSTRETKQGSCFSYIHHSGKIGVLLELLCETDFVGSNDEFRALGREIAMQISFSNPADKPELLKSLYIRQPEKTIENLIQEHVLKIGENISLGRFVRYEI